MHNCSFSRFHLCRDTIPDLILYGLWFAGLSLGFAAVRFMGDSMTMQMLPAARVCVSRWGALCAAMLPLFFSAFAVYLFDFRMVFPACFLRGFGMGLMLNTAAAVFGRGAWLAGSLLLFSLLSTGPMLLWYWRRRLHGRDGFARETLICALGCLGAAAADHLIISPFLVYVMNL